MEVLGLARAKFNTVFFKYIEKSKIFTVVLFVNFFLNSCSLYVSDGVFNYFTKLIENPQQTIKEVVARVCSVVTTNIAMVAGATEKQIEFFNRFKTSPVSVLNDEVYSKFICTCNNPMYDNKKRIKCKTDNETGIHYKQYGKVDSKKYIFFFTGCYIILTTE